MEGLVFLVIIYLVGRSLYKNSKEAKRKAEERRQRTGEEPAPQPNAKPRPRMPGSLPEWIEMLEGKIPMEREAQPVHPPAPAVSAPSYEQPAYGSSMGSVPQGVSTEGCQTYPQDCEAPHRTLQMERGWEALKPTPAQRGNPFACLEGMPEAAKAVLYAEILTRPQQRRRLRP